jgi:hypothetical protein
MMPCAPDDYDMIDASEGSSQGAGLASRPGVGWNRALQSARFCDTWVICEGRRFADIDAYVKKHGRIAGLQFRFVAKSSFEIALDGVPGLSYLTYNLWHRRAYRLALQMHTEAPFDLVHHATYTGYREPGYLWQLDAPFIWGPVGGT